MHELEGTKLVRHHAKRLRQLGAEESLIEQMIAQLSESPDCSPEEAQAEAAAPRRIRKTYTVKARQGALGFRARAERTQEYSVVTDPSAGGLRRAQPNNKRSKQKAKTKKPKSA
jgi:hypothetical protein